MLNHKSLVIVALAVFAPAASLSGQDGLTEIDRESMQNITNNFVKAVLSGDLVAAASAYTQDAMLLPPNQPEVKGRNAIQQYLTGLPKLEAFDAQLVEIEGTGNLAYTRGTYEMTFVPPGAKAPVNDRGKFIEVRRREPDGTWRILRDFWNSDLPPAK